jgi:tetratricopeptide (TPR) repeat protein
LIALKKLKIISMDQRIVLFGLLISYISCQMQSLVSIDNIGVGIWNWVIGGFIIGFQPKVFEPGKLQGSFARPKLNQNSPSTSPVITSWFFGLGALILVAFLYQGEKRSYDLEIFFLSNTTNPQMLDLSRKVLNTPLIEPTYKVSIADKLFFRNNSQEAIKIVSELLVNDPNNLVYLDLRANFEEALGNFRGAIEDRVRIAELNPYNANNYRILANLYKKTGQLEEALGILQKVKAFGAGAEILKKIEDSLSNNGLSELD